MNHNIYMYLLLNGRPIFLKYWGQKAPIVKTVLLFAMCSSRKNLYPPHGRSFEIPRGRGVLKGKFLEAVYKNKLEFPGGSGGGGGVQKKNLLLEEYGYFLEPHCSEILGHQEYIQ